MTLGDDVFFFIYLLMQKNIVNHYVKLFFFRNFHPGKLSNFVFQFSYLIYNILFDNILSNFKSQSWKRSNNLGD